MSMIFFFLIIRRPPIPTLFPYTTLFRSELHGFTLKNGTETHVVDRANGQTIIPASGTLVLGKSTDAAENDGLGRSEEHTSELQSRQYLVCRLLLEKKKKRTQIN